MKLVVLSFTLCILYKLSLKIFRSKFLHNPTLEGTGYIAHYKISQLITQFNFLANIDLLMYTVILQFYTNTKLIVSVMNFSVFDFKSSVHYY